MFFSDEDRLMITLEIYLMEKLTHVSFADLLLHFPTLSQRLR